MDPTADPAHADLVLAGILLPLLAAAGAAVLTPLATVVALLAGAVPATGTLGYALFYAPPARS